MAASERRTENSIWSRTLAATRVRERSEHRSLVMSIIQSACAGRGEADRRACRQDGLLHHVADPSNVAIGRIVDCGRKGRNSEAAIGHDRRNRAAGGIFRLIIPAARMFAREPNSEQPKDALANVFATSAAELALSPQGGCIRSRNSALLPAKVAAGIRACFTFFG